MLRTKFQSFARFWTCLTVLTAVVTTCELVDAIAARAQTFVGCTGEPEQRGAELLAAVASSGGGTIELAPGCIYDLRAPATAGTGFPIVGAAAELTIVGHGATIIRSPLAPPFRFFAVAEGGRLTLRDVELSNGEAPAAENGGAIASRGTLVLERCRLVGNAAGTSAVGRGGNGGAVAIEGGSATIQECFLQSNDAGSGAQGGGHGGALYVLSSAEIDRTTITANFAGTALAGVSPQIPDSGSGGDGGGVFVGADAVVQIAQSTLSSNVAGSGGDTDPDTEEDAGVGGRGGGVANFGELGTENATLYGNTGGASGRLLGLGGGGGGGTGGAVYGAEGSTTRLSSATVAFNTGGSGPSIGSAAGGAVSVAAGGFAAARNTIFRGTFRVSPRDPDQGCVGDLVDEGGNLQFGSFCGASRTGDPALGPLADNGGPTQTMALLAGSAAIDAAEQASCPTFDQRGTRRPPGACDVGAFERVVPRPPAARAIRPGRDVLPRVLPLRR